MMPSMNGIFFFKSKQMDEVFSARPTSASASSSSCMGARTRCWACQTLWRRRNTGFCFILLQHYTALQCTAAPHFSTLVQFTDLKDSEQECSIFFFFSNKECSIFFFSNKKECSILPSTFPWYISTPCHCFWWYKQEFEMQIMAYAVMQQMNENFCLQKWMTYTETI